MRVGILGGAFNPPHIGHLVCAQEALVQLELDRVLFVPVGVAPHREIEHDPGAEVARYDACAFVHRPGQKREEYGEAAFSRGYAERKWADRFEIVEWIDDPIAQNVLASRPR